MTGLMHEVVAQWKDTGDRRKMVLDQNPSWRLGKQELSKDPKKHLTLNIKSITKICQNTHKQYTKLKALIELFPMVYNMLKSQQKGEKTN